MMIAAVLLSSIILCLCLCLIIALLNKLWWAPNRLRRVMASQGITGPTYRFIHGSTKELMCMRKEAMSKPMGLSHDIAPRLQPHVQSWANSYGKSYIHWLGPQPQMVITEPDMIKEILNDQAKLFPKPAMKYLKPLLGNGIVISRGEKWAKLRKLASHAFQAECLKGMVPSMIASVEDMVERWKGFEGKEIEVYEEFTFFTSEVISSTAFGSSYSEGQAVFEMLKNLIVLVTRIGLRQRFPGASLFVKSADQIESEKLEKRIHGCIEEIIKKREESVMSGEKDDFGDDLLGVLLNAHHDVDHTRRISVQEMVDECKTFYIAGQETTSSLLTWTMLLLAMNTNWQESARKEVLDLFGKKNPKLQEISRLKIVALIINESLRLYPPAISVVRKVEKECRLRDLNLPANIGLSIPILTIHHDPVIWGDDAHLFKPERFLGGIAEATNNNIGAFLPFGIGPRTCPGSKFAIMQAKIALVMILQCYSFTLSPAYVHSPTYLLITFPQHGLQLILNHC